MKKVSLGRTGFMVSQIGFGGIPLTRVEKGEAVKLVRHAFERGITFFDTANMYGDSEEKFGQALKPVRGEVTIATKSMARAQAVIKEHLELSLKRLSTDHIDLYQAHHVSDPQTLEDFLAPGGGYEYMAKAKDQGRIRAIGISSHNPDVAANACASGLFDTVQVPFNFVEQEALEKVFPAAGAQEMGLIAMKPLGGGLLDQARLCFGYLQQHPQMVPIPGIQSQAEIDEILDLYESPPRVGPEEEAAMEAIRRELGDRFCHRCGYCMPCPEGVNIPAVLMFPTQVSRFDPQSALKLGEASMATAENCLACGECDQRCPYGLPVSELVADARDHYRRFSSGRA